MNDEQQQPIANIAAALGEPDEPHLLRLAHGVERVAGAVESISGALDYFIGLAKSVEVLVMAQLDAAPEAVKVRVREVVASRRKVKVAP